MSTPPPTPSSPSSPPSPPPSPVRPSSGAPTPQNNLWDTLSYRVLSSAARGLARLDFSGMHSLAKVLGGALWHGLPARRRLAETNIQDRLGLPAAEARELARESFNHNALSFLEAVLAPQFSMQHPLFRIADPECFHRLQTVDRSIVAATAHLGSWELEAGLLGEIRPSDTPRIVVVRRYKNPAANRLISELRGTRGAQVFGHRDAAMGVLRALKKRALVAFLVDHNSHRDEALFLPFLGKTAAVNKGPALLAVRAGALIWPFFMLREGENRVVHMEDPLDTTTLEGDTETRILAAARFYTEAAERAVRRAPEQWFWMHNRWKTQPE